MAPHPQNPGRPLSPQCLEWILSNQSDEGFWLERSPTDDHITVTLACLVVLKTWNVGSTNIEKGLEFLNANMEKLLMKHHTTASDATKQERFAEAFPSLLELAEAKDLAILLNGHTEAVKDVFLQRERRILTEMKLKSNGRTEFQVEPYIEIEEENERSVFGCSMSYLKTVVQRSGHQLSWVGNEDFIRLCMVDHMEMLGCGEHFAKEIKVVMDHSFRNWIMEENEYQGEDDRWLQIYKDSLSFRLLRMHGYHVSPRRFCWFVEDEEMCSHMEENYRCYLGAMYNVYKASNLMFPQEDDLNKARAISRKLLHMWLQCDHTSSRNNHETEALTNFQFEIERELRHPWLTRLDHLEHRHYIERSGNCYNIWLGKRSLCCRLSFPENIFQLAMKTFMMRQSVYRVELENLERWSRDTSLSKMGFGRDKTAYLYFASAASTCLPLTSDVRNIFAKCGTLVTFADDFFDEEGPMDELCTLTEAVKRWEGGDLSGHSKVIFDALEDLVSEITLKFNNQDAYDLKKILQDTWQETFVSWLKESEWSRSGQAPTIKEYLKVGMISIGIQAMLLPGCYMKSTKLPEYSAISRYSTITELLMLIARLLNDIQSYEKEAEDGKLNMVLLYLKEKPNMDLKGSIEFIKNVLERKTEEFLAIVLSDGDSDMPKDWKELHLSFLKVFHMFFHSSNAFDSPTAMLNDVNMAIYAPLDIDGKSFLPETPQHPSAWKEKKGQFSDHNILMTKAKVGIDD